MKGKCKEPRPLPSVLDDDCVIVHCACGASVTVPNLTPLDWIEFWYFDHSMPVTQ